jgi:hypothetical protein
MICKEIFIVKVPGRTNWYVQDDRGITYEVCLTRWGARRVAKRFVKRSNERKAPIKEFIGEIN